MAKKDLIKKPLSPKPTTRPTLGGFLALRPKKHSTHTSSSHKPPHSTAVRRGSTTGHHGRPASAPATSASAPAAAAAFAAAAAAAPSSSRHHAPVLADVSSAAPAHRLRLIDLDRVRSEFDIRVASTIPVARLEETIRHRHRKHPLGPDDAVRLYRLNRPGSSASGSSKDSALGPHLLQSGDVVGRVCSSSSSSHTTLYYRVLSADADARHGHHYYRASHGHGQRLRFRIDWPSENSASTGNGTGTSNSNGKSAKTDSQREHRTPHPDVLRQLARDILNPDSLLSVDAVRARLAGALGIREPARLALVAHGGLQPGQPLAGDAWILGRLLAAWLCQCLVVQVHPARRHIVVRGGGGVVRDSDGASPGGERRRTYLLHEPWALAGVASSHRPSSSVSVTTVQQWVRERLLKGVHEYASSALHCRSRHVAVVTARSSSTIRQGTVLDTHDRVSWGSTIEFRLRDDMVEAFADDETWLLPRTETCMICLEDKAVTELPHRITAACLQHGDAAKRHVPTLCKPCLAAWIASSLSGAVWNRLRCPECPARLGHADVRLYAEPTVFARYDTLATRAALESEFPGFRWCLAEGCTSGQIHGPAGWSRRTGHETASLEEECPKFRCVACHATHCIRHNMPWHAGETCEQYDHRTRQRRQDNQKSETFIQKTSKPCPSCHKAVFKYTGCNHISCVCGHEWCYICFAPFVHSDYGILRCQHRPECSERDLFDELGLNNNNPNNRRPPFMPPLLRRPVQRREQRP